MLLTLVAAIIFVGYRISLANKNRETARALRISDVDSMAGHNFERYIATLLEFQGFHTKVTKGSGDSGVDIVAKKDGVAYAIQCKRSASGISRRAVSDAVAGIAHYGCTHAMVVTNRYFTPGARALAASNRCILVDRDMLATWISHWQRGADQRRVRADA
ncbi:restriction endonuclease [Lysobacter terrae]